MNKQAIIILGGGLTTNLELNEHTKQRFNKAIELISKNNFNYIVCSTDKSYRKLDEIRHTSEARVGREYLISKGINPNKILLEEKSRDTLSNAYFCRKEIIDPLEIKKITIVTSKFHLAKTKFVFELIFPKEKYELTFIESNNGNVDKEQLQNRIISEKIVLNFYKNKLLKIYNIKRGDMKSIGKYITEHNPSFTGKRDKHHEKFSKEIEESISGKDPLF